ncbi:hypothetical protein TOPH_00002 [Tolypocladium ophioglossoides CBS 100239]|uniref:Rhodopsin domain-containing protein n=1 Tax=Tolypocladium ophioglossoides (strain CBS 100239) TaxID=1163406 RepID=A0A0L0NMG7_TOLOC|nr:hypothetical protein TOPH_00002 [Tolypocladium ophioglossoides CBS 100239]
MASDNKSKLPGLPGYDPDNLQPWSVQVIASATVLAVVAVALRLLSRRLKRQQLWWDDGMIVFSVFWNMLVIGFILAMYSAGMGIHADKVNPEKIVMMAKWLVVAEILYAWNLGWTKISLLLMYYRIFHVPYFKKMAWVVGVFVWVWVICITFLFIFICVPVQKLWYPDLPGHCIDQVGTWISNAASTILTDLVILLMPIPQIWKLQLRKTEKVGLTVAFSLGFFVVFASAYRTSVLFTYTSSDPTYSLAPTVGWTVIELSAGIVSACLPTLLPIVLCCARWFGFKRSVESPVNGNAPLTFGSTGNQSKFGNNRPRGVDSNTRSEDNLSGERNSDSFYRLPDNTDSDDIIFRAAEIGSDPLTSLRPDMKGCGHAVRSYRAKSAVDKKDDIPLHGIRVEKVLKQSASKG